MNKMEKEKLENLKNLFKWESLWKEAPWIILILAILVSAYGYYDLRERHFELLNGNCTGKCIWNCRISGVIKELEEKYPGTQVSCDYQTKQCYIDGVAPWMIDVPMDIFEVNISKLVNDSNK